MSEENTKKTDIENSEEDFVIEPEEGDSVKNLREKLKKCVSEKQDYLTGWQRSKADFINYKKQNDEILKNAGSIAIIDFIAEMIPVLDSLDSAIKSHENDQAFLDGISGIKNQITSIFLKQGVKSYNPQIGEEFDPSRHICIGTEDGGEENKISKVLASGYENEKRVIRPAIVSVYKHN